MNGKTASAFCCLLLCTFGNKCFYGVYNETLLGVCILQNITEHNYPYYNWSSTLEGFLVTWVTQKSYDLSCLYVYIYCLFDVPRTFAWVLVQIVKITLSNYLSEEWNGLEEYTSHSISLINSDLRQICLHIYLYNSILTIERRK